MALEEERGGQAFAMEEPTNRIERTSDETANVDTSFQENHQPDWVAPSPVVRPTLFSGGGEDPLAQLDLYCRSLSDANNNHNNNDSIDGSARVTDTDELLSVAEFLFGQKALTAALAIVDSRRSLITKLVAPSGRSLHTIRSSSSTSSFSSQSTNFNAIRDRDGNFNDGGSHRHSSNNKDGENHHYLCLLSPFQASQSSIPPVRYCSCRSFLEKSTKKVAALSSLRRTQGNQHKAAPNININNNSNHANLNWNDENYHDGPPVCKHLLALFLLPHLAAASEASAHASHSYNNNMGYSKNYLYPEIKAITEKEFAGMVLDRIM